MQQAKQTISTNCTNEKNHLYSSLAIATAEVDTENKNLFTAISHEKILYGLKSLVKQIDFQAIVYPDTVGLKNEFRQLRKSTGNDDRIKEIDKEGLQKFFGEIAESLGVPKFDARHYTFRESLLKQFLATAHLSKLLRNRDNILMNFINGTLEITPDRQFFRPPAPEDFLT